MAAVHRAQEARQQAAATAAAAAAAQAVGGGGMALPGGEPLPMVVPLDALVLSGGQRAPVGGLGAPTPEAPEGMPPALTLSGRPVRRTRSLDPAAPSGGTGGSGMLGQGSHHSLPLASTSSGGLAATRARRSPAGKQQGKGSVRTGHGKGPGKAVRAKQQAAQQQADVLPAAADAQPAPGLPAPVPDLAAFGEGYQPRGASATAPPKSWLLKARDLRPWLQGALVQVRWQLMWAVPLLSWPLGVHA